ncbi:type II toxin-antitoxin system PemK/MazF family toxin [Cupriavidus plantarum]|uniref:type II toxin-antitoxin system PemK/MazF family toxin n=1 Tax=Cupriavidus plantarum TaxID=942865 RepID=UPI0015CBA1F9|nr:type II toxin-antitoxin system PemK/MazF family toxin [Cupriavidus plantarum]NYH97670.1 uncharacterized protein YifN (PemK superfamily) [Cupriavidus plantarum]
MIVILYEEATVHTATGAETYIPLGHEAHHGIEQVLLPVSPTAGNPIFLTKKFIGHAEYRWQVHSVRCEPGAERLCYRVRLIRRTQIDKQYYLKNILAARRKGARGVLHPWAIVEVEFGHHFNVGDAKGAFRDSKQYVDTIQLYSMPKRRLAVVTQVIERKAEDLVQVIPISSKAPGAGQRASIEVTSQLTRMVQYQKPSWAICEMIQTVTASRIIAPLVAHAKGPHSRDTTFGLTVRGHVRAKLKDAILYGVAADGRVLDTEALAAERTLSARLSAQLAEVETRLELFSLYERVAADSKLTLDEMRQLFPEQAS